LKKLPEAHTVAYWKTSHVDPGSWIEKASEQIQKAGGQVLGHMFGTEYALGRAAYLLDFTVEGERFKVVWPVLPSKREDELAARRQAATLLFHDVKARCLSARVLGLRRAFFSYMLLSDGRAAADHVEEELIRVLPAFPGTPSAKLLPESKEC